MPAPAVFQHPRYEIVRLLGEGGMGRVFLARDLLEEGLEVAVKLYPAHCHQERLRQEFLALRELRHPAIARALNFGRSLADGAAFFTLEYIEGLALPDYLGRKGGRRPADRLECWLWLLTAVTGATAYLHRRGLLHLDIKPDNILVMDLGPRAPPQPVLIDFGLVHSVESVRESPAHGTLPYMAPELFQATPPTQAADVYSLAAAFYRALAGRYPVAGTDFESLRQAHQTTAAAPLPEAPPAVEKLLLRALAKNPEQRFASAAEFHRALMRPQVTRHLGTLSLLSTVVFHEPEFVGRQRELAGLAEWLQSDRREAPVFEVRGGEGWGKTRFLEKAATELELEGRKVLFLQGAGGRDTSLLERCLLSTALLQGAPAAGGKPRRPSRTRKARGGRARPAVSEASVTAEGREILGRKVLSRLVPLLADDTFLIVDDLQLADRHDLECLTGVARALAASSSPPGGGIVVARTDFEEGRDPLSGGALSGWAKDRLSRPLELGPLSLEDALAIDLEGLDGALAGISRETARRGKAELHRQVGGHPLFFVRGLLDLAGATSTAGSPSPREALLATLEETPARMALTMACLRRPSTLSELTDLLAEARSSVVSAAQRLRRVGILALEGERARIIHDSVGEGIIRSCPEDQRRETHRRLAECFAHREGDPSLAECSWHLLQAGDVARALELARLWIARGLPVGGGLSGLGLSLLSRAAELSGTRSTEGRIFRESEAELLERLGRYEEAHGALSAVTEQGLRKGAHEQASDAIRRLRKLGTLSHRTGRVPTALKQLRRCLTPSAQSASPSESFHARVELALLHHFRGETGRALDLSREGIEIWRGGARGMKSACRESAVHLHAILGQIHIRGLRFQEATTVLRQGLRLAERSGSRLNTAVLLNNLALAYHLAGEFAKALTIFQKAESMAQELEDIGALASIRCNRAQILSKKGLFQDAQAVLDELEGSPAVRQSRRLQLYLTYSRGLLLSFLRADAGDIWETVQELAADVGDVFLQRLARIYLAEGEAIHRRFTRARSLLECSREEWHEDPVIASLKTARRACVEALAGETAFSRGLRRKLSGKGTGRPARRGRTKNEGKADLPDQLLAWNRYYLAVAAGETGDFEEARGEIRAALGLFRRMGYIVGELECHLVLADLLLRSRGVTPVPLGSIEKSLHRARGLSVQSVSDAAPRLRDVRTALIEVRLLLTRLLPGSPDLPSRAPTRPRSSQAVSANSTEAALARISDLLARAAGDPALSSDAESSELVEVLTACTARIRGERAAAREATLRVFEAREQTAASLQPADRKAFLGRDPWAAYALSDLRCPPEEAPLEARHGDALASLVLALRTGGYEDASESTRARLQAALEQIARATTADRAELIGDGAIVMEWTALQKGRRRRAPVYLDAVASAFPGDGSGPCFVRVLSRSAGRFSDADRRFLDAAAALLEGARSAGRAPQGTKQTGSADGPGEEEPTAGLPQTRTLALRKPGTEAIARFLEDEGFVVAGGFRKLLRTAHAYASSDLPVLITGESGTGKNVLARIVHLLSSRRDGPFLAQNAGAVPRELFEADLFGYESGAFTSAERTRTGFLFRAEGGTFHIEEVGDLDLAHQRLLLRVLEEKAVRPLGAPQPRPINVRFVASTHRDIDAMVRSGEFRHDLFFRLNAARIHVPALRERPDEIPPLVRHFWRQLTGAPSRLSGAAQQAFLQHDWPGNVRELVSVLRRLSLEAGMAPSPGDVRAALGSPAEHALFPPDIFHSTSYEDLSAALEESFLNHLLSRHDGSIEAIAAELGTTTRSVYRRFERLGLQPKDLKRRDT